MISISITQSAVGMLLHFLANSAGLLMIGMTINGVIHLFVAWNAHVFARISVYLDVSCTTLLQIMAFCYKNQANDQLGHFKYLTFIFFCFFTFVMSIDAEKKQALDTGDDESANTCIYERRLTRYNSVI